MSKFDDRERAEEARYALDQEVQFKIGMRRNKLLGLWAAEKMNVSGAEAEAYAKSVVLADLEEVGDDDVVQKLVKDFAAAKVNVAEAEIRSRMAELIPEARKQIMDALKK